MIHPPPTRTSTRRRGFSWRRTTALFVAATGLAAGASVGSSAAAGTDTAVDDSALHLLGKGGWKPDKDLGSFYRVTQTIDAPDLWKRKGPDGDRVTGGGIGVALIDSGVVPVAGLDRPGKVITGPDLSFDSQDSELATLDGYGHGTHLAGIIAGRDERVKPGKEEDKKRFVGVAPDAHIVSVKVGAADGAVG